MAFAVAQNEGQFQAKKAVIIALWATFKWACLIYLLPAGDYGSHNVGLKRWNNSAKHAGSF